MAEDKDSFFPKEKEAIRCAICGHQNFRKCSCPWKEPFQYWPPQFAFIKDLDWPDDERA